MIKSAFIFLFFMSLTFSAQAAEKRCGWLVNPTPANWWLNDSDGEWTLSAQMGFEAEGMDLIPEFPEDQWVITNAGSYGYGCACMSVDTTPANDTQDEHVTRIYDVKVLPLSTCENDKKLAKVED